MEDKYLALIIIVVVVCSTVGIILFNPDKPSHGNVITICPACKICPTCEDCQVRIDYCFEKCSLYHTLLVDDQISKTCMWNCLHPDYGIAKLKWKIKIMFAE